eukprot:CFRG7225T1
MPLELGDVEIPSEVALKIFEKLDLPTVMVTGFTRYEDVVKTIRQCPKLRSVYLSYYANPWLTKDMKGGCTISLESIWREFKMMKLDIKFFVRSTFARKMPRAFQELLLDERVGYYD